MRQMNRQAVIDHTVSILSMLPQDKAAEVSRFADFLKQRYDEEAAHDIGADSELQDWQKQSVAWMAMSYGDDEPDYSDVPLLEVNPHFSQR